jgi:hypothetical protein
MVALATIGFEQAEHSSALQRPFVIEVISVSYQGLMQPTAIPTIKA